MLYLHPRPHSSHFPCMGFILNFSTNAYLILNYNCNYFNYVLSNYICKSNLGYILFSDNVILKLKLRIKKWKKMCGGMFMGTLWSIPRLHYGPLTLTTITVLQNELFLQHNWYFYHCISDHIYCCFSFVQHHVIAHHLFFSP